MLRILIIGLGTYAVYHTDLQSGDVLQSFLFPAVNGFYLLFLFINFVAFLRALGVHGTPGNAVNPVDLGYDVLSLLHDEIADKYAGKFAFLGGFSGYIEDLVIPVEIGLVIVSFYQELQLLAYLAN